MEKFLRKVSVLLAVFVFCVLGVKAQDPLAYLRTAYPKLTNLYESELSKYPAHYIFAIDVSGTMNKYEPDVLDALRPFFQALPDNDRVDVIPFGSEALSGLMQYQGIISPDVRNNLCKNLGSLYNDPTFPDGFKKFTYVDAAVNSIVKVMQSNRDYKINVIVILTDFRNENPDERKFTDQELKDMADAFAAASNDIYTRAIALQLPIDPNVKGYVLPQLRDEVFKTAEHGLEIVPMGQDNKSIKEWFDQLKRNIMVDKLSAIITDENRVKKASLLVETSIDGDVKAEVHWTPTKLYPSMQIDSTYLTQKGFYFENNKKAYTTTRDSVIGVNRDDCNIKELVLGKIKYESWGFHHLEDSIHLGILLPTEYDNELASLNIHKPIPATTRKIDEWVFTFFLPFWLTATIVVLLILYIIGVIKAIARNNKLRFKAKVTFMDNQGYQIDEAKRIPEQAPNATISIGSSGNARCEGAEWTVSITKVKPNPFLVFPKPYFRWKASRGYVASGSSQTGKLDYKSSSSTRLKCGTSRNEITHMCRIQMQS